VRAAESLLICMDKNSSRPRMRHFDLPSKDTAFRKPNGESQVFARMTVERSQGCDNAQIRV
jgi:hypothetical protein